MPLPRDAVPFIAVCLAGLLSLPSFAADPSEVTKARESAQSLSVELVRLRNDLDKTLRERSVVTIKEQNFRLHGEISGSLNGHLASVNPVGMAILGGLFAAGIGLLAGPSFAAIGPAFAGTATPLWQFGVEGGLLGGLGGLALSPFIKMGGARSQELSMGPLTEAAKTSHRKTPYLGLPCWIRPI